MAACWPRATRAPHCARGVASSPVAEPRVRSPRRETAVVVASPSNDRHELLPPRRRRHRPARPRAGHYAGVRKSAVRRRIAARMRVRSAVRQVTEGGSSRGPGPWMAVQLHRRGAQGLRAKALAKPGAIPNGVSADAAARRARTPASACAHARGVGHTIGARNRKFPTGTSTGEGRCNVFRGRIGQVLHGNAASITARASGR
jgi:hypothetical protein